MNGAVTRRTALRGSMAASHGLMGGAASAQTGPALSANDRRLLELAEAYEALDRRCDEHAALHRYNHTPATDDEFDILAAGFEPLEEECAAIPADSLAGVIAKARLCRSPTAQGCAGYDHITSVADDLYRLHVAGRLANA